MSVGPLIVSLPLILVPSLPHQEPGELLLSDFSKFERPALLHVGMQALDAFEVGGQRR